jgi:hypothetical protein
MTISVEQALTKAQDVLFALQESNVEDVDAYDLNGDYCPTEDELTLLEVIDFLQTTSATGAPLSTITALLSRYLNQLDAQVASNERRQQGIR